MANLINNVNFDLADIGDEVTVYSVDGTNTETAKYLNLEGLPNKVHVANNKACVITAINGQTFTNPRTVSAAVGFGFTNTKMGWSIRSITIRAADTDSHFEVMMW